MAAFQGLNPDEAASKASSLRTQLGFVTGVATEVSTTRTAAMYPENYGIEKGEQVISPMSLADANSAATMLHGAVTAGVGLLDRLDAEIEAQIQASKDASELPVVPDSISSNYYGAFAVAGYADGITNPDSWMGRNVGIYRKPTFMIPDPALRDPTTGLYRGPGGMLLPGEHVPQVMAPGSGKWTAGRVPPMPGVPNGTNRIVNAVTSRAATLPGWVKFGGKSLGPVSAVVGAGVSGYNAGAEQWNEDTQAGISDDRRQTRSVYRGTVTGVSSGLGAAGGAWAGAALGAAIGSIFPGPGTVIGGIIGGIIGGVAGSVAAEKGADAVVDGTIDNF